MWQGFSFAGSSFPGWMCAGDGVRTPHGVRNQVAAWCGIGTTPPLILFKGGH